MTKKYHVVKYTFTVIQEHSDEESAEFYFTEHNCAHNAVRDLHAASEAEGEFHICNICAHTTVEYVGAFESPEDAQKNGAWDLNTDRIRARLD